MKKNRQTNSNSITGLRDDFIATKTPYMTKDTYLTLVKHFQELKVIISVFSFFIS